MNIVEILKDKQEGCKLHSPMLGVYQLKSVSVDEDPYQATIEVRNSNGTIFSFDSFSKFTDNCFVFEAQQLKKNDKDSKTLHQEQ